MPGQRRLALTFGKKTKTIYEGGICTPEATRFRGRTSKSQVAKSVFLRSLCSLTGYPQPPQFQQASTFLCWCRALRQTPEHPAPKKRAIKPKLCAAGELSASFSFKLDSVSVKQHVNQNAEAEAFRSRMRHSRRPSSACQKNKRAIKPKLCVAEVSFQSPFKLVWKWYFNSSTEAPFWSKSGI